ncbi:MAG TPA: efflux transporter outer membrane subunit [Steroidobacteraceae bacterium]|jgi:multidrug efflux system outer membrane protein|nr:efflux transporter outer membrane subunit [Steroidobacteraceae bacterium]
MIRTLTVASLAAAVALVGCTMIPPYRQPALPVPAAYPGPVTNSAPQAAADIAAHEVFRDERLNRLVDLALLNNRDLRTAVLNVQQTEAQYRISRSSLLPTIQGSAGATRSHSSFSTGTLEPGVPTGIGSASSIGYTSNSFSASVGVTSYELDLFGHVRSQNAQALEQYFQTEEAQRAAQVSLVGQVATQYLVLRETEELLTLSQNTLTAVQSSYDLNKALFDAGASNELDFRQSEGQVETARINVETYQRQLQQARNALELLLGAPIPVDLPPARPFSDAEMVADVPAGLPSDLIARRPDILEAEHALKAANANIGVARAAFFPTISLTGSVGVSSTQLSSLFKAGSGVWSFGPQISLPLFAGGHNVAELDVAKVGERLEVVAYEKAIQSAFREVADALVGIESYARQITLEQALIDTQQRRLELATLRYRQGEDTYLNELAAQQDLFSAQQGLLQAQYNRLSDKVSLYQALGGGWK